MTRTFTAFVEWDPVSEVYVGSVPGLTGAHTQAATLESLRDNLREVVELCVEESSTVAEPESVFVGTLQVQVADREKIQNTKH